MTATAILAFSLSSCKSEKSKDAEIMDKVYSGKYDEARKLTFDRFKGDRDKQIQWFMLIGQTESTIEGNTYKKNMVIQKGWRWEEEERYNYIRGRVKNTGTKTVTYFKLKVEYQNARKEVVDTDYTNSGETLGPGMAKEFEIMHHNSEDYKSVAIGIEEVKVK